LIYELRLKEELRRKIEDILSRESREKALNDHHSRRKPRPCGFTIHTGIGCSLQCTYCYIGDMGFSWSIREYPLNGVELVYALLNNPYFVPGENGSLIAIGSVTEPFHGVTRTRTLEYIESISKYLGNPIQFSTKMYLTRKDALFLRKTDPGISPLITIVTIKYAERLEPYAPPPSKRFKTIKNLREAGLKPILFLRPIIPGLIEDEYIELIDQAVDHGAHGLVAGSLRITRSIIERFKSKRLPVREILERAPCIPKGREQVSIDTGDLKREIARYAMRKGLLFFPEACMANLYTHGRICWKMIKLGLRVLGDKPPVLNKNEVFKIGQYLGLTVDRIRDRGSYVDIWVKPVDRVNTTLFSELVKCRFKKCVRIHK